MDAPFPVGIQRVRSPRRAPAPAPSRFAAPPEGAAEPEAPEAFPPVMTLSQAARFLQVGEATLSGLCRDGAVPHWRGGSQRLLRFSRRALEEQLFGASPPVALEREDG